MYPYMSIYAVCSVASHCDAHFCAHKICIYTNNAVYIKYRTQNPMQLKHLYSPQTLVLSVTAGHIPPPFFVFRCYYNIQPPMFLLNISPKPHPSWRRYTFLSHLTTKSKISVRWIKKLVAATCGVCVSIHKLLPSHS